ncbi:MAG: site-2 protease family protein [Okeania sp. SIO2D1]|nr:site-2 protease family protein [Okeania sp. SIO2D1]
MFIELLSKDPIIFFSIVAILIISISLHELAHGVAALSQGDDTPKVSGHMTLNPIVHMGWQSIIFLCLAGICWGQMPVDSAKFRSPRWGQILVAAAGPLLNFTLGLLFTLFLYFSTTSTLENVFIANFCLLAARMNFVLFLFNLLPVPPLDGFHFFGEIFPALKSLGNSPWGLAAFMILFLSGASVYLFEGADFIIEYLLKLFI